MECYKDPVLRSLVNQSTAIFPDGLGVVIGLKLFGCHFKFKVRGADLMLKLCSYASTNHLKIFLYGSTERNLTTLQKRLKELFPQINIVGTISPPFRRLTEDEDSAFVSKINQADPDILFVALGAPKQERWMAEHRGRIKAVQLGVGAAFDFITGNLKEAPLWMQKTPLEWLHRLPQQPQKTIWRMRLLPPFALLSLFQFIKMNRLKRIFDVTLSLSSLIVSFPLWLLISLAILFEDGRPIFFVQERIGKGGKIFKVLKFRSMDKDAEEGIGSIQAVEDDPRVTKVGRILRPTAMDELPQLINILKGDMSFVGPRALRPAELEVKGNPHTVSIEGIPGYRERLTVRPGLTGLAQVYLPTDALRQEKFHYDLVYIKNQSLWLDLKLTLLSFWITFRGKWESRGRKI
jgi:exopolysaccharide biosynthesis WecB/TagA/CpsF family protein